jgi:sugar lactone lactonase YvrE
MDPIAVIVLALKDKTRSHGGSLMTKQRSITLATAVVLLLMTSTIRAAQLTTVASFDPTKFEIPENITFDVHDNLYVSLILSNEVRKITPAGVQSTYASFDGAPGSLTAGLVINDQTGDLFVAYNPIGQNSVVYVVHPDQTKQVFATFPVGAGLNGMTPDFFGNLYLADSFLGYIWRVPASGGTPQIWLDLHAPGTMQLPGPNGIKFDALQQNLYVSVSYQGTIYRIPMNGGQPGTPVVFASGLTPDDFAFDLLGNLYVATEPSMSVVRIHPDGSMETLASAADGLQNTTAVRFGRGIGTILDLYILSSQIPPGPSSHPGVYRMFIGLPGFPVSIP